MNHLVIFIAILILKFLFGLISCQSPSRDSSNSTKSPLSDFTDSVLFSNIHTDSLWIERITEDSASGGECRSAVIVGNLFNPGVKYAITAFSINDSLLSLKLFQKGENTWTILQSMVVGIHPINPSETFLYLNDIDGDNINDLLLLNQVYLIRSGATYKAFCFRDGRFIPVKGFEQYPNPEYDFESKKIYSYMGIACADMTMSFICGHVVGDSIIVDQSVTCDCCRENTDSCDIKIPGKPVITARAEDAHNFVPKYYKEFLKQKLADVK